MARAFCFLWYKDFWQDSPSALLHHGNNQYDDQALDKPIITWDAMHKKPFTHPRFLIRSVLKRIIVATTLVVAALTALAYSFIYNTTETRMLDNLSDWVVERARNDGVIFELAQENLDRFSDEFLRLYTSDVEVSEDTFWSYFQAGQDGAVRMHPDFYDGIYADDGLYYESVTSFVGNNEPVADNPDLQRRLVLSARLLAQLGPAWVNRFENVHVTYPENAIALYAPGTPWGLEAEPDLPMNELGVIRAMQQSENPQRMPSWTGLYFDETAEEWMITYQVPLDLNGRHLINPSHDLSLTDMMEKLVRDTPEGGYNLIFREDGYLIAHPAEPASDRRWVGEMTLDSIDDPEIVRIYERIAAATGGNPGTISLVENETDGTWLAVSELSGPGWWFVSVYPQSLISTSANQAATVIALAGLVLLLLLIGIITYILRRDAEKPLAQLHAAAESVREGDYASVAEGRVKLPRDLGNEVGLLANTFYDMTVSIRDAQASLEQVVSERTQELEAANSTLRELSLLDGLLGIHNRRAFDRDLMSVFEEASEGKGDFHLMLIDVDYFKRFNDTYGHMQGDDVLKRIALAISESVRAEDRVYRYGGEELAVIFNGSDADSASSAANRVMSAIEQLAIDFPESDYGIVTVSAGLVHCSNGYDSVYDVVTDADSALYASKRQGRNRLTVSDTHSAG